MADCLFCKIASGDIPAQKVYEDDTVVAFRDIAPQMPVHILVIPRAHIESAACVTPDNSAVVAHCFEVIAGWAANCPAASGWSATAAPMPVRRYPICISISWAAGR